MLFFFLFSTCKDRENHSKIQTGFPSLGINPSATQESSPWWLRGGGGGGVFCGTHCVPGQTHRQNRWSRALSLLPNPHRQKQKKKAGLTLNGCLPDHCAVSQWSSRLCGCMLALPCSTLTFFIQTTSLPLPGKRTPPFSARSVGTTRARLVFIPRSIYEKRAGGFPGAIEALEVWTFQLEFPSTHCHLYNRLQAQNIFSFNISYLICRNIWQWIQFTSLLQQHELSSKLLAHHPQQLYFSRLTTGLWGVIVLKCEH